MSPPDRPRRNQVAALIVFGPNVSEDVLEMLSIQLELLLEELDRAGSQNGSPRFRWESVESVLRDNWVLVGPSPEPAGAAARTAGRIMDDVRRGISVLTGGARRPPRFTEASLAHLEWIAAALEDPQASRLVYYAGGQGEDITLLTLKNLRSLLEGGAAGEEKGVS